MKRFIFAVTSGLVGAVVAIAQPSITWKSHVNLVTEATEAMSTQSKTLNLGEPLGVARGRVCLTRE